MASSAVVAAAAAVFPPAASARVARARRSTGVQGGGVGGAGGGGAQGRGGVGVAGAGCLGARNHSRGVYGYGRAGLGVYTSTRAVNRRCGRGSGSTSIRCAVSNGPSGSIDDGEPPVRVRRAKKPPTRSKVGADG